MLQLLFTLLGAEVTVVLFLLVKNPLRKFVVLGLDRLKRGRGPIAVRTIAGTIFIVFVSSAYSMIKIQQKSTEGGSLSPTDQVLWSRHLLEASLMGYTIFLALVVDRMHHYIRELRGLRKNIESVMKQNGGLEDIKTRDKEIESLKAKITRLELESNNRTKEAKAAEANAAALKKQSEGFLLEYDRLLEDNQDLRNQLQSIDRNLSHSDGKKNT